MKKANQKRLLGDIAIEGGNFTTAFFKKSTINELFDSIGDAGTAEVEDVNEDDGAGPTEEGATVKFPATKLSVFLKMH